MRATRVLQKCLSASLEPMHRARARVLLLAVEALIAGRRLTMMDLARSWPGAERVRAPLKAVDRLLGNPHLHVEREQVYANMARWLLRGPQPVIVIDWSGLKPDVSWCLLRAAVPMGGRTLPILDMVCPGALQGSPIAERRFLEQLRGLIPEGVTPILVTDAGFRTPWFMAVNAMGWHWVGRLRGRTLCKSQALADRPEHWVHARDLFPLARSTPRELPPMHVHQRKRLACRCVLFKKPGKGRKHWNHRQPGKVSHHSESREAARREREPWLLLTSPALKLDATRLVKLYARRMQIELSFRDLKSHRYGQGFEDSLTRTGKRIEVLLLINALAAFASWLAGLACEATGVARWLVPIATSRKLYSTLRTGREALARGWPLDRASQWLERLRRLPTDVVNHMQACA